MVEVKCGNVAWFLDFFYRAKGKWKVVIVYIPCVSNVVILLDMAWTCIDSAAFDTFSFPSRFLSSDSTVLSRDTISQRTFHPACPTTVICF